MDTEEEVVRDYWSNTFPHILNLYNYKELDEKGRYNELVKYRKKYLSENANNIDEVDRRRMNAINKMFNEQKEHIISKKRRIL